MVSVTIRHLPDEARDRLAERAERAGQSLQEYLRLELIGLSERLTVNDWLDRVRDETRNTKVTLSIEELVQGIREDRERH